MSKMKEFKLIWENTKKESVLRRFYMDKARLRNTLMIVRSLNMEDDYFDLKKKKTTFLVLIPDLSVMGSLMYLSSNTF